MLSSQIPFDTAMPVKAQIEVNSSPVRVNEKNLGIKITAPYAVAIDVLSGKVLYEKKKDLQTPLASITKLMTAIVFLEKNPGWDTIVTIQAEDIKNGSQIYLFAGDKVDVKDLFYLSLISSSNEATSALVRSTGMTSQEFIALMNKKAKDLGLTHTFFVDPTGLEPANISTAYEISVLAKEAFSKKEIYDVVQKKTYSMDVMNTRRQINAKSTDKLLDSFINDKNLNFEITGAKTGFIEESLYNFTAQVKKGGSSVIIVLSGSKTDEDRWAEAKGLVDWVFSNYEWPKL